MLSPKYTLDTGGHAPTYRERKPQAWSKFYHSDYLAIERKSFPVWHEAKLHLDAWNSGGSIRGSATVEYTSLVSAKAVVVLTCQVWPSWGSLIMNGSEILGFNFSLGGGTVTKEIDVTGLTLKGRNEFLLDVKKIGWVGWGDYIITLNLVVEGEKVSVSPPAPWEMWPTWWPYATAGAGMAAVGGVILLKRKR